MTDLLPAQVDKSVAHIRALVDTFSTEPVCVGDALSDGRFFLDDKYDALSRRLGNLFWLPVTRAYAAFCYAYGALFGIPDFTREALTRQADRFSQRRLALTIRSTSGFVLDGFGYDRRTERYRKDIYWPGPVIRSVHAHSPKHNKARISNPAMAYFGYHLIRAAEWLSEHRGDAGFHRQCRQHYDFVGDFFRSADYPFPVCRCDARDFSRTADALLAGDDYADCWHNISHAATDLGVELNLEDLASFLPKRTRIFFARKLFFQCSV